MTVPRETIFYDIPQEWRENAKKGLCPVCGKHRAEFQKFMRVYCSPEHRDEYNARIYTWASMREQILKERGLKCEKCGITPEEEIKRRSVNDKAILDEWVEKNRDLIELERAKIFQQVEELYSKALDDAYVIKQAAPWELRRHTVFPDFPKYEVDHKVALVNGGDQWDVNNLQVLCEECHKKKTAEDVRIARKAKKEASK